MTTEAQVKVDWQVLSDLCCLLGVSGHEAGIRAYLDRQLTMCQQGTDPLGSGLYSLAGQSQSPLSLLFSTHMDEIGWVCRTRRVRVEISSPHTITHSSLDKAVAARGF